VTVSTKRTLLQNLKIEAHAAWLATRDPRCPWDARIVGLLVAGYALSPIDLIPDFIPVLGLLDDALLIPAGLWLFVRLLPPGLLDEHRAAAARAAERPSSRLGILIVLLVWALAALLTWQAMRWAYA
jgi:uncharacterized membrane protein YkvA (DUF1232 family)